MLYAPLTILALTACGLENGVSRNTYTDTFNQEPASTVDILWVIDDSGSMETNQSRVAEGFEAFAVGLESTNIDFHLGVITTDMDRENPDAGHLIGDPPYLTPEDDYLALFQERVQVGIEGSGKEKGLSAALEALTEPTISSYNEGFLREDAVVSVIFVSDEEDCSDNEALADEIDDACYLQDELLIDIELIIEDFRELKDDPAKVSVSGIIGPPTEDACESTWYGRRYEKVINATGGVVGSICERDYDGVMDQLGLPVAGLRTVFELSHPALEETIEVSVDEEPIENHSTRGWTYDEEYFQIRFDGSYVPERNTTISVTYEIAG